MNIQKLLVISLNMLLDYPTFAIQGWANYARKAWMEPIVIRDGFHDYVLMSSDEYRRLTDETVLWRDGDFGTEFITKAEEERRRGRTFGSPDLEEIAPVLAEMAKIGVRDPNCTCSGCEANRACTCDVPEEPCNCTYHACVC